MKIQFTRKVTLQGRLASTVDHPGMTHGQRLRDTSAELDDLPLDDEAKGRCLHSLCLHCDLKASLREGCHLHPL